MTEVTRGEFDMLKQLVATNAHRVESIDDHGTRGVTTVQAQLAEVVKDVATLQASVDTRFDAHLRQHEQDRRDRVSGRRWLIGVGVAGIGSMGAVITLLVQVLARVHG